MSKILAFLFSVMYFIQAMLDVNDTRLSEDQKRLVEAFNSAADFLIARASASEFTKEQKEFLIYGSLEELNSSTKRGQTNSAIAGEATILISKLVTGDVDATTYSQALKTAGYQSSDIFYCDILPNSKGEEQVNLQAEYRKKIELELLLQASQQKSLPIEYLRDGLRARMPS